ncbi:MAG: hypothetical protein JKY74_13950 [Shewanella sp.]|nr:hypothetical protein [Shewanella sp.]
MPTMKVNDALWKIAEEGAVDATLIRRQPVRTTEVITFILKEFSEEAIQDFLKIEKDKKRKG